MKKLNLPSSWPRMSTYARAQYLTNSHQAPDFRTACQVVNKMRVAGNTKQPRTQRTAERSAMKTEAKGWYLTHDSMV